MNKQLIIETHPADGYFKIKQEDSLVSVSCRWPFDIETDDWIEIQNKFSLEDYSKAVTHAVAGDRGEADGIDGGFITIEQLDAEQTLIEISNSAKGWSRRSLQMKIAKPITSFAIAG